MGLNLHLLRLFVAVATRGSFSQAAEALHVSQPAVSRGVREFEAQVGARLLERGPGGVTPTEAGRLLLRHATVLFATERAAEEELAALRGLTRGSLTIGASTTVATWFLPSVLGAFHRAHPAIELRLRGANTAGIVDLLLGRELDVALVEGPVEQSEIEVLRWRDDRLAVIAAPSHPLATAAAPLPPAALADALMIDREPGSGTREVVRAALLEHGVLPARTLDVGSTETIKQVVAAGIGIGIVSAAAVGDQLALGSLVELRVHGFAVSRVLSRLRLPGRRPSPAAAAFDRLLDQTVP